MVRNGFLSSDLLVDQLIRFALSGGVSTATYLVVAVSLLSLNVMRSEFASATGYVAGIVVSYILQSRFTFRVAKDTPRTMGLFAVLSLAGFVWSYLILHVGTRAGIDPYVALVMVCVLIPCVNFLVMRIHVFRKLKAGYSGESL